MDLCLRKTVEFEQFGGLNAFFDLFARALR